MPTIDIQVIQGVAGGQVFADLIAHTSDLTPLMQNVAAILFSANREMFSEETGPNEKWAELALSTQKKKLGSKPRGAHPILIASGEFYSDIRTDFGSTYAEIGTSLDYPRYLQSGTSKMPARPVFGLRPQDEASIIDAATEYLATLV